MAYTFSFIVLRKILCKFHKYHISLSHTKHDREIWDIYKEMQEDGTTTNLLHAGLCMPQV